MMASAVFGGSFAADMGSSSSGVVAPGALGLSRLFAHVLLLLLRCCRSLPIIAVNRPASRCRTNASLFFRHDRKAQPPHPSFCSHNPSVQAAVVNLARCEGGLGDGCAAMGANEGELVKKLQERSAKNYVRTQQVGKERCNI